MNIVQNSNAPSISPTNGCCAGVADITGQTGAPIRFGMTVNGSTGGSSTENVASSSTAYTYLYFVGKSGDYDNVTFSAGTWTVPINHQKPSSASVQVSSVYICRCNSSGVSQGTIASLTGLSTTLTIGVNTFSLTGVQTAFNTGDVVVVSFQFKPSTSGNATFVADQTITTPSTSGGNAVSYFPTSGLARFRGAPATLLNQATGSVTYTPQTGLVRVRGGVPSVAQTQAFSPAAGLVRIRGVAAGLAGTGAVTYTPTTALLRARGAPANASPLTAHIRFLRGPQAKMPPGWPEGAPFEGGIITPSGSVFTMLFLGGHDGQDKIVGGGFQTCSGQPAWAPVSDGSWVPAILDSTNLKLWLYVNGAWHYLLLT